jgi:hypothetical protein
MFFTRTHKYYLSIPKEEFKKQLIGKHVKIHNLDFEVVEDDATLVIIPHTEQVNAIKTLPLTYIDFNEEGTRTRVTISSEMRKVDAGGPMLIVVFCAFMFIASIVLFFTASEMMITMTFAGISILLFTLFTLRMQTGYFDYVRKVRAYVKSIGMATGAKSAMAAAAA